MSLPAIEVSGLSKRYVIERESRHDSLRDTLHHSARKLWRRLRWGTGFEREEFWALRDVSFSIQPGEVVGVIGRNGAGKSTLLKILSRITEPTSGQITLRGRVASLLEVGTGFHPDLSGRENIYLNGAILGMQRAEIRKKFDEIVAFAEIERFLDTPVKRYSSGMYVRLAFAVAAHLEPEILIVDEVLAVGDAQFQKKCLGKMQDVARNQGRTVLFVSHQLGAVGKLCSRSILMEKGRVEMFSDTPAVIANFLDRDRTLAGGVVDIAACRVPGFGTQVHFTSISAFEEGDFSFGSPVLFDFEVQAAAEGNDMSIGGSIFHSSGECVGTFFTQETFSLAAGETKKIRVCIAAPRLVPGSYHGGFSVGRGNPRESRNDFDVVIGLARFNIHPVSILGESLTHWLPSWGSIYFDGVSLKQI